MPGAAWPAVRRYLRGRGANWGTATAHQGDMSRSWQVASILDHRGGRSLTKRVAVGEDLELRRRIRCLLSNETLFGEKLYLVK